MAPGISPDGSGPRLHIGSRGDLVRSLQRRLCSLGFNVDPIDGIFGVKTAMAVKAFQHSHGLAADGVAGPETQRKLGLGMQGRAAPNYQTGGFTANSCIQGYDASVRITQYVRPARELAQQVLDDVESGLPHLAGRARAVTERNALLDATRQRLSPGGRAFSRALKEEGKTLLELIPKYARKVLEETPGLMQRYGLKTLDPRSPMFDAARYEQVIEELGHSKEVSTAIIRAAGRTGREVTALARFSRVAGPVGAGLGLALSGYEIVNAPEGQKLHTAGREASGFAGGLLGSMGGGLAAAWTASLLCGPGAPVCAIAVSLVVVGGSAYAGGALLESGYEALTRKGQGF